MYFFAIEINNELPIRELLFQLYNRPGVYKGGEKRDLSCPKLNQVSFRGKIMANPFSSGDAERKRP